MQAKTEAAGPGPAVVWTRWKRNLLYFSFGESREGAMSFLRTARILTRPLQAGIGIYLRQHKQNLVLLQVSGSPGSIQGPLEVLDGVGRFGDPNPVGEAPDGID